MWRVDLLVKNPGLVQGWRWLSLSAWLAVPIKPPASLSHMENVPCATLSLPLAHR